MKQYFWSMLEKTITANRMMKKAFLLLTVAGFFHAVAYGQKKYEMVIEKTDGTEVVIKTENVANISFRERDESEGPTNNAGALIGTWAMQWDELGVIGIKITSDGKAYYNEWSTDEQPNFDNVKSPADVEITDSTIKLTHSMMPGYYEEYAYVLSNNGTTVMFTLISYALQNHGLTGPFIKIAP